MTAALASFACAFYSGLTIVKSLQWAMHEWGGAKKEMYSPSSAVFLRIASVLLFGGKVQLNKVPRKEFREITDRWLKDYTEKIKNNKTRKPKTFATLDEARKDFFVEFCQDSFGFYVSLMASTAIDYANQPLGFCSVLAIVAFISVAPFLLLREICVGGSPHSMVCKVAVASTANGIYVVCCKEGLTFEEALHRYGWVTGLFQRPQLHPMIGGAVCPMYQRKFLFPEDHMMFDVELLPNPSAGVAVLRQVYPSQWQSWWKHLPPTLVGLALLAGYILQSGQAWDMLVVVAPYASLFYVVRMIADHQMGLNWISIYRHLP